LRWEKDKVESSSFLKGTLMRDLLFYGGTIVFWIGLIGCYVCMKNLRTEHAGMNFHRLRSLAKEGNDTAKKGVSLLIVAAVGVTAQIASLVLYS
jgi:hypothetical protein